MCALEASGAPSISAGELFTAEDLERLPEGERLELIRGELCPMPNNSAEHGDKTMRLSAPVAAYVYEHDLGRCFAAETRFTIEENPDTTMGPDFAFISEQRLSSLPPKGYLKMAPDLVLETKSPGDTKAAFAFKIARWLSAGVRMVWALDPAARSLTVHRTGVNPRMLLADATLDGEDVLPGFTLPMARIFRESPAQS